MKKTIALLAAVCATCLSSAWADDNEVTLHDVTFTYLDPAFQGSTGTTPLSDRNILVKSAAWTGGTNAADRVFGGFYLAKNSGIKFNNGSHGDPTVTHLYIDPSVSINTQGSDSNGTVAGTVNWNGNNTTHAFVLSNAAGAWVDIDKAYSAGINVSNMSGGTVYLNKHGMLGGTKLASGNTVVADAVLDLKDIAATPYTEKTVVGDNLWTVTRTLLSGDYTGWTGTVTLNFGDAITGTLLDAGLDSFSKENVGNYWVEATSTGLKVTYVMPEPATATLSLLALAGLAARRRRK